LEFLYLKNEPQRSQSFPQRAQSFKIYLCVTLRFTLRSLRLNKKVNLNCVTHKILKYIKHYFFKKRIENERPDNQSAGEAQIRYRIYH